MLGRARFDPRPRSEARYRASRRFLRDAFAAWSTKVGSELGPDSFEELIHYKWGYLDGHLTCWRADDLDAILLELFPAKVIVEDDELADVIPEARAFIAFLADEGLLDPTSEDPEQLCAHLEKITGRFRRRMAERDRYSPGKRFWLAAAAAGVDFEDNEAVAAFAKHFNARPEPERAAVLAQPNNYPRIPRRGGRVTPAGTQPLPRRSGFTPPPSLTPLRIASAESGIHASLRPDQPSRSP